LKFRVVTYSNSVKSFFKNNNHCRQDTWSPWLWNAGFIRQADEPHVGWPDESGVPVEVPDPSQLRDTSALHGYITEQ
jgi:hypothetical protein